MPQSRRALLAAPLLAAPALAQAPRPTRRVRSIMPFSPGGLTDTSARALSDRLGEILGQNIVIENRAGGGAEAVPDLAPGRVGSRRALHRRRA